MTTPDETVVFFACECGRVASEIQREAAGAAVAAGLLKAAVSLN